VILTIELEKEDDGRWLAEVIQLPGVMAYGVTDQEAVLNVKALALRVIADRLDHREHLRPPYHPAVELDGLYFEARPV
jgi:predicted RNase H-like HicB family nuclease